MNQADDAIKQATGLALGTLNHVGIVVRDLDATIRRYQETLGIGPFVANDRHITDAVTRGERHPFSLRVGFAALGPILFEVIQPVEGRSLQREFLDQHGEGLQHLAYLIPDVAGEVTRLGSQGLQVVLDITVPERQTRIVFVEGEAAGGVLWELIQSSPANEAFYERLWSELRR